MSLGPWWAVALKALFAAFLTVADGLSSLSIDIDPFVRRAGAQVEGDHMASINEIVENAEADSEDEDDVNVRRAAAKAEDEQANFAELAEDSEATSKGAEDENDLIRRSPGLIEHHKSVLQAAYVEADGTLVDVAQQVQRGESAAVHIDSMGGVHGQDDVSPKASLTTSPVSGTELPTTLATLQPSVPRQVRVSQTLVQEVVDANVSLVRSQDDESPEASWKASPVSEMELPNTSATLQLPQALVQEMALAPSPLTPAPAPPAPPLAPAPVAAAVPLVPAPAPVAAAALPAACVASACGSGYALKPNFASLQCAAASCAVSDQATCCDVATLQPVPPAEEESGFMSDLVYVLFILMVIVPCMVAIAWFFVKHVGAMKTKTLSFMPQSRMNTLSQEGASDSGTPSSRSTRRQSRAETERSAVVTRPVGRSRSHDGVGVGRSPSLAMSGSTPDGGNVTAKSSYQMRRASRRNIDAKEIMRKFSSAPEQVDGPDAGGGTASADAGGGTSRTHFEGEVRQDPSTMI